MKRLAPSASFGNELHDEHYVRDCLNDTLDGPTNIVDYAGIWERAGRRAREKRLTDPEGRETIELLRKLQFDYEVGLAIRNYVSDRVPLLF